MLVTAYPYLPILFTYGIAIPHRYNYHTSSYEIQVTISNTASNFLNYAIMGITCDMEDFLLNPLARLAYVAEMVAKYRRDFLEARQKELTAEEIFHLKPDDMTEMSNFFSQLTSIGKSRIGRGTGRWDSSPKDTLHSPSYSSSDGSALLASIVMEDSLPNLKNFELTINLTTLRRYHGGRRASKYCDWG
jgi:hypothetical protein